MSADYAVDTTALAALTLLATDGVGRRTVTALREALLRERPDSPSALCELLAEHGRRDPDLDRAPAEDLEEGRFRAEEIVRRCAAGGILILTTLDERFPAELRSIPDPPAIIYVRGDLRALAPSRAVAVVGTRAPSDYGARCARRFGQRLAERGLITVAGLAVGIDTEAFTGALGAGGRCVAVLAHGLHTIYPASNAALARRIAAEGGALVSEYAPGTEARKSHFVERDRLQSALSAAVIAVETGLRGGTQHTIRFAREQGRPLATIVHPAELSDHPAAAGPRQLIERGEAVALRARPDLDAFVEKARREGEAFAGLTPDEFRWVEANKGTSPLARNVATFYDMASRSPADTGARGLLEAAVLEMRAAR